MELVLVDHMDEVLKEALVLNEGEEIFCACRRSVSRFCLEDRPGETEASCGSVRPTDCALNNS